MTTQPQNQLQAIDSLKADLEQALSLLEKHEYPGTDQRVRRCVRDAVPWLRLARSPHGGTR